MIGVGMAKCQGETRPEESESRARDRGVGREFHPCFQAILDWTDELKDNPPDNLTQMVSLGKLKLDATKAAVEDLRLRDGLGAGTTHVINVIQPGDKPRPPVDDNAPPVASEGDSGDAKERVLN
jgi:hypothetical protein